MTTITLTHALVEIKKLDQQIQRASMQAFVGFTTGEGVWEKPSDRKYTDKNQAASAYKSALDSVQDLITRRTAIKGAIVKANAVTLVKVADVEMTIAEAIERKNSISFKQFLLDSLRRQQAEAVNSVTRLEAQMQTEITKSRNELAAAGKSDEAKLEQSSADIKKKALPVLNDPNGIQAVIEALEKEIEDFVSNVDVVLSVANATTTIEV
ncbi:hypothetical protein XaC1_469 [Xanthomonas phage XaC1]|nr:hypothetical protein XaC1_469 [Xanthomonas phage XaC1]